MHIGEKIKMVRQLRRLTQEQLGNKINRTRSAISFIEQTGKVHPDTLDMIVRALNIPKDDLMTFDHKAVLMKEPASTFTNQNAEIESLKIKLASIIKERDTLKALVKSQSKIISMLEKRKKN